MERQKYCPLAHHQDGTWGECLKEECRWWEESTCHTGQCAAYTLSISLNGIFTLMQDQAQTSDTDKTHEEWLKDRQAKREAAGRARGW